MLFRRRVKNCSKLRNVNNYDFLNRPSEREIFGTPKTIIDFLREQLLFITRNAESRLLLSYTKIVITRQIRMRASSVYGKS